MFLMIENVATRGNQKILSRIQTLTAGSHRSLQRGHSVRTVEQDATAGSLVYTVQSTIQNTQDPVATPRQYLGCKRASKKKRSVLLLHTSRQASLYCISYWLIYSLTHSCLQYMLYCICLKYYQHCRIYYFLMHLSLHCLLYGITNLLQRQQINVNMIRFILVLFLLQSCTSMTCTTDTTCERELDSKKTFKLIRTIISQGTSRQ